MPRPVASPPWDTPDPFPHFPISSGGAQAQLSFQRQVSGGHPCLSLFSLAPWIPRKTGVDKTQPRRSNETNEKKKGEGREGSKGEEKTGPAQAGTRNGNAQPISRVLFPHFFPFRGPLTRMSSRSREWVRDPPCL